MKFEIKEGNDTLLILLAEEVPSQCDYTILHLTDIDWNADLSPWYAEPLFPKQEPFSGGGDQTLEQLLKIDLLQKPWQRVIIAGYSLGGLFALYACTKTDIFDTCLCVSGSLWYPQWIDYLKEHPVTCRHVYLSLGDAEAKTRNKLMSQVDNKTQETYTVLKEYTDVYFTYNPGNHFFEAQQRMEKAIAYSKNKYH